MGGYGFDYNLTEIRTNEDEGSLKIEIFANTMGNDGYTRHLEGFLFVIQYNPRNVPYNSNNAVPEFLTWDTSSKVEGPMFSFTSSEGDDDLGFPISEGRGSVGARRGLTFFGIVKDNQETRRLARGPKLPILEGTFRVTNRSQLDPSYAGYTTAVTEPLYMYITVFVSYMNDLEVNYLGEAGAWAHNQVGTYRTIIMPPLLAPNAIVDPLSSTYVSPFNSAIRMGSFLHTITYNGVESISVEITANTATNTLEGWLFFLQYDSDYLELVLPGVWSPMYNRTEELTAGKLAVYGRRRFSVDWRTTVGTAIPICKIDFNWKASDNLENLPTIIVNYMLDVKQENYVSM
jgi:hypothetical protein